MATALATWVVLSKLKPFFRFLFIRVPYQFGDLESEPPNYPKGPNKLGTSKLRVFETPKRPKRYLDP